jgi:hypothetical protein
MSNVHRLTYSTTLHFLADGSDGGWKLPLPPLSASDVEPYGPSIDQGEVAARHEAALKVKPYHNDVYVYVHFVLQ